MAKKLRYTNNFSYARIPFYESIEPTNPTEFKINIGIVGIPFDGGCSFRTGARFGPSEIRKVSCILREYNIMMKDYPFGESNNKNVVDFGDINVTPFDITKAVNTMYEELKNILSVTNKYIILGGDHTISYPSLKAIAEKFGPVSLIHFDAHLDTYDVHFDCEITHGTPFKRATDDGLLNNNKFHIGLRGGTYCADDLTQDKNLGFVVYPADEISENNFDKMINTIKNKIGSTPTYISIDIDVVDPAFAPGTGTPEIGGFSSRELLKMIRTLKGLNIVGADIVEVSPPYDNVAQTTALLASTLCYELLTIMK